jgi:phenylacetate-CoA ligase
MAMTTPATTWQPEQERIDREELEQLQLERLEATLTRAYRHVPYYRKRFDEVGFDPDGFRSLADLARLPFTTKEDLRTHQPYGLFAVPLRDVVRVHASSGTTGQATAVGFTRNDLRTWAELTARTLVAGGVTRDDVVQIAFDYGLFTGAFGLHAGAERLGASVIPVSSADAARQVAILKDYKSTALCCAPSRAVAIADAVAAAGLPRGALHLRWGLFGAEPWSEVVRRELEDKLGVVATDNYGLSEVMGPGVAGECLARAGLHVAEDHFLVEVVDPSTLVPVAPGQPGELVVTTLSREATPLVRYRTRDLTALIPGDCACGRTLRRIERVKGRTDDLLFVKGVKVFPSEIEAALFAVEGALPHFQVVLERRGGEDQATVLVEVDEETFFDEMKRQAELKAAIQRRLATDLGVAVEVRLVGPRGIERVEGKARRVVDRRGDAS